MGRKLAANVTSVDETGRMVTFEAGAEVSEKVAAGITRDDVWEADSDEVVPYAKRKKADLEAEVETRNANRDDESKIVVAGKGTVADLAGALEADDAANSGA